MGTAASVLACALSVLGRSQASMPPIELIDVTPPGVSAAAEAFVRRDLGTIYVITSSAVFREAAAVGRECRETHVTRKLASILAHEEWHVRHGADEKSAYEHQLITLIRLGVSPGTGLYRSVQLAMLKVLDDRKRGQPERVLARR
jgi:hypothetical protein